MSQNPQEFKRTRHIQVRYHFIRELIQQGKISLKYCNTKDQLADILTKGLNSKKIKEICSRLQMYMPIEHGRELNIDAKLASRGDP